MHVFGDDRAVRLAITCLIACVALVLSRLLDFDPAGAVAKLVASTAFLGVAWVSGARESRYGSFILTGLVLSWLGDMFLLGDSPQMFLAGLASFLLAHVSYVTAFSVLGLNDRWTIGALPPVLIFSLLAMLWLMPSVPENMILPVRAYTFVISIMLILSFGAFGRGASWIVPAGATLFYVSDLSVAALQFTDPGWPVYVLGLPFYYTGQLMLAASVRFQAGKENG
jgi:uncharacterized membrane protein YhhN